MKVLAVKLREALSLICLVPDRSGILPSEMVRLSFTTDTLALALAAELFGEFRVPTSFTGGGEHRFFVHRKLLSSFINACDDAKDGDDIEVECDADELRLKYKRRRAKFLAPSQEVTGYAKNNGKDLSLVKLTSAHKALIRLAAKYAPLDPTTAELNCVYLRKGKGIQSSNQLIVFSAADPTIPLTMPFPLMLPEILANSAVKGIAAGEKGTRIDFSNGYLFQLINEKCRTDFPSKKISDYVSGTAKLPTVMSFKPQDFLTQLQRFQSYMSGTGALEVNIKCKGQAGKKVVFLTSEDPKAASFHEVLSIDKPLALDFQAEWPLAELLPFLDFASQEASMSVLFEDKPTYYNFKTEVGGVALDLIVATKTP